MPYVLLSDDTPGHPQIAPLSDRAFRLHVTALCHCGRYLTDGLIQDARTLHRYSHAAAGELCSVGLWRHLDGHRYEIVNYLAGGQQSREQVERRRIQKTQRQARWRGHVDAQVDAPVDASTPASVDAPVDAAPIPNPNPNPKPSTKRRPPRPLSFVLPEDVKAALAPYLEVWNRLSWPVVRAKAEHFDEATARALLAIPLERFGELVEQTGATYYVNPERARKGLSLPGLVHDPNEQALILATRRAEAGGRWCCALCKVPHPAIEACPPKCGDCGLHHESERLCDERRRREKREEYDRELEAFALSRGLTDSPADLRKAQKLRLDEASAAMTPTCDRREQKWRAPVV